jgi:TRAP-type C4-dicarboxylate transport system permease small subunit
MEAKLMQKASKMIKIFVFLLFWLSIAGYSLDRTINWIWTTAAGTSQKPIYLILGIIGLIIGVFFVVRIVYRIDKQQGKVKKEIKFLE